MNATLNDGYRTAGDHVEAAANWYLNLIATYGAGPVLAVELVLILAAILTAGRLIERAESRYERKTGIQDLEAFANHPANHTRKEEK